MSLFAFVTISNAQEIDSVITTSHIACNGGTGDFTVYTNSPGNVLYNLYYPDAFGNWQLESIYFESSPFFTISNRIAATYFIELLDVSSSLPTDTAYHTLQEPFPLVLHPSNPISTTLVSCFNGDDGTATINLLGGSMPYTYSWSNGQNFQTATGLSAGSYTCNVSDTNNCPSNDNPISVTVTQPLSPVDASMFTNVDHVDCYGDSTGSIALTTSGGTPPYSYGWSNGENTSSIIGLTAGLYSVMVTDANACSQASFSLLSDSNQIPIVQPLSELTYNSSETNVNCFGESTGSITLTISGGTAPYSYLWSNGDVSSSISGLTAGTYSFIITDDNSCTLEDSIVITQPNSLISSNITSSDVTCFGETNGSFNVNVTGGTAPYTYLWSNGSTNASNTLVSANTYYVQILDSFGCLQNDTVLINQPDPILVLFSLDSISCPGGLDGVLSAQVSGGTPPFNYSWTTNSPFGYSLLNDSTIEQIGTGNFTVNINDANLCFEPFSYIVTDPDAMTIPGVVVDVSCNGDNTGSITTNTIGGTPPYSYLWVPNSQTTSSISALNAGSYTVHVDDANNCYSNIGDASAFFTVDEPIFPLTVVIDTTHVLCSGQSNGSAEALPSGGTGSYSYLWSTSETSQLINNLSAGAYSVIVEDDNLCQHTVFFDITEPSPLNLNESIINPSCFGYNNGMVTVIPSGGSGVYSYLWDNGHTGQSISNLSAGSIGLTVTDATNSCSISASYVIGQPSEIHVGVSTNNNNCFGGSTGTANTIITDPFPPFRYLWSTGDTVPNISSLSSGTYSLVITNLNGCMQSDIYVNGSSFPTPIFNISDPLPIDVIATVADISVFGANDGSISVIANGGTGTYSYNWNGPFSFSSSSATINNLTSGFYQLSVSDANGCIYNEQFTINEPNCNILIDTTYLAPLCYGNNAEELSWLNSGGLAPYTSELTDDNGSTWYGPNSGLNPVALYNTLPPGVYNISVSDMSGCFSSLDILITQPDSLTIDFTASDVVCFGGNNGSLSAIASGGTPGAINPYNYFWSPLNQISFSISNLIAGTYSVVVTDANNCQKSSNHTIIEPNQLIIDSMASTFISCSPGVDGTATVYASGGIQPFIFNWNIPNSGIPQTTQTATLLSSSGNYSVGITDGNGCIISGNINVENAPILLLSDSVIQPSCYDGNNGIIYANASGGSTPYSYNWSINGVSGLFSNNSVIGNLSPATYSVIVEDSYGCINQFSTQISNPSLLTISSSVIDVSIHGANDGSINTTVSGGTGTYTYNWNGPNGFTSTLQNINFLYEGIYSLVVVDGNGCASPFSEVVNEPVCNLNFDPTVTFDTDPACYGQSGQITWMANGGGQFFTPTSITNSFTGSVLYNQPTSPNIIYNQTLPDGSYTLYVEDEFMCNDIFNFTISSPNLLSANLTTDSVNCFGGTDGSMLLEGVSGTPPYFINYGTDPITGASLNENSLSAGFYTAIITDNNGCQSSPSYFIAEINEPNQIIVNYTSNSISCFGSSDGEISVSVTGGTFPYSYNWQGSLSGTITPIVSNLAANDYFIDVLDANLCVSDPQTTMINVSGPSSIVDLSINTVDVSCFNLSDGQAQAFVTGGTPPYSYQWNNGQTSQIAIGLTAGNYTCTVIDANGCINSTVGTVNEPNVISINLSTEDISCFGLIDGYAIVNPIGGSGTGFSVLWPILDPLTGLLNTNLSVSNFSTGNYTVIVTDLASPGCSVSSSLLIEQPDMLLTSTNEDQIVTCFDGNDGEVSVNVIGGTDPFLYNWSSITNNSISTLSLVSNLTSQMYYIDIIDSSGCLVSDSIFLSSNDTLLPNLSFDPVSCFGGDDGIAFANPSGGTAPYHYIWSVTGSTLSSSTGLSATPFGYVLFLTDDNGCSTINPGTSFTVPQPDSITMNVSVDNISCFLGTDGQILINSVTGAISPYSYLWSNGQTGTLANNLIAGSYTCTITDSIGCVDSSNVYQVNYPDELIPSISITSNYNGLPLSCYGDSDAELTASVTGGNVSYTYDWLDSAYNSIGYNSSIDNLPAGVYSVIVTDNLGCSGTDLITIVNPDEIQISFSLSNFNGSNISCFGNSDGSLNTSISGPTDINFSSIIWTDISGNLVSSINIENDTILNNMVAGTYFISVSDINGCTATASVELTEPDPLVNNYSTDSVTCYGGSDGAAYADPQGGTAPYQIFWSTGSTNDSIFGLDGITSYSVQIYDANNCPMVFNSMFVPQPDILVTTHTITTPTCYGNNDGQIFISSVTGATGPYTYLWNDTLLSTGTFLNNINSGEYICTITDALDCEEAIIFNVDTIFSVFVEIAITSNYGGLPLSCYGDSDAELTASVTGGNVSYTYDWLDSAYNSIGYNSSIDNLPAGVYSVIVTDNLGCSGTDLITIVNPDEIQISFSLSNFNGSNISCFGNSDGSLNTSISGPTDINFSSIIWTDISGNLVSSINIENDTILNNMVAGTYFISVSDINGCTATASVELTEPDPLVNNYSTDSVTCYGGSDGAAYADPQGGTAPYQIFWSTGSTNDSIFGLDGITSYSVQIYDANNCPMVFNSMFVPQPDILVTTHTITTPTCYGNNDGQIFISSVTGATGPYTYLWNDTLLSTGTFLNNINSGEYICTITDALDCEEAIIFNVDTVFSVVVEIAITSNYNGLPLNCYGDSNATILAFATGGTGAGTYTYFWEGSPFNNSFTGTLSYLDILSNIDAGTYIAHAIDDNGCQGFLSVDILNPDPISYNFQTSDYNGFNISCNGGNDGSIDLLINGGNGIDFNTLLWNTGDTDSLIDNLSVGTYSFSVEDINSCSANGQITLTSPGAIYLELSSDTLLCFGDSDASSFIDSLDNAINPLTYLWNNGQNGPIANNLASGTYSLTIIDDNDCFINSSINVNEPNSLMSDLVIAPSYNGSPISCYGAEDAIATITSFGGVTPYTYSLDSIYYSSISTFNNLGQGFLNVWTSDANGCSTYNSMLIQSPTQISANLDTITSPSCDGVNNGEITSLTTGGIGQYYYQWSTSSSVTNVITSLFSGIHTVTITDDNGCVISDSIVLNSLYNLNSITTSTQVSCTGSSDGEATINVLNGTAPFTYLWNNGMNMSNIAGLSAGTYDVLVTDDNGCQLTNIVEVTESDSVLTFISNVISPSCYLGSNGSIEVNVSGGLGNYTYLWSTGETSSSITNLIANSYTLNISDSVNCLVSGTFTLTQPLQLTYNLSSSDIICFGNNNGNAEIQVSGGTLPYTYLWNGSNNFSSNNQNLDSLISGIYFIDVNDSNGCTLQDSIEIEEPQLLSSTIELTDPLCYNSNDGTILINILGGISPYTSSYGLLNPTNISSDSIIYLNLGPNNDILYVYDANNCENQFEIILDQPSELKVFNFISTDPSCFDYLNGSASIDAVGGTPPYSYQLLDLNSNIINSSSLVNNLANGNYLYVVKDDNECLDDIAFDINNPNEISIIPNVIDNVNCFGDFSGSITVDVNNVIGSYQIIWSPIEFNTNSNTVVGLSAGQYNAVVIDDNGCTKIDSFEITQNDDINVILNVKNSTCKTSNDGEIEIVISGGMPPFSINNDLSQISSNIFSSYMLNSLLPASYAINIIDSDNCEFNTLVNVDFDGGYDCINEPTIISPNFDNYNDVWTPILDLDTEISVSILNRWGQKEYVYIGNSLSFSWNGMANWTGVRELPTADYYYIIKFNNNNFPAKTGVITLIR